MHINLDENDVKNLLTMLNQVQVGGLDGHRWVVSLADRLNALIPASQANGQIKAEIPKG